MALRDKLAERAAPFLEDGEVVQQAFRARVRLLGTSLAKATYVLIGTQDTVLILRTSNWSTKLPKKLVARVPKSEPMSLRTTALWARLQIGGEIFEMAGRATLREAEQLVSSSRAPAT